MSMTFGLSGPTTTQSSGALLTLADIDRMFDIMRKSGTQPDVVFGSPRMKKRLVRAERLWHLYRVHPAPHGRTLRKCQMRRIHAAWRKGKQKIRRKERMEARWEQMP